MVTEPEYAVMPGLPLARAAADRGIDAQLARCLHPTSQRHELSCLIARSRTAWGKSKVSAANSAGTGSRAITASRSRRSRRDEEVHHHRRGRRAGDGPRRVAVLPAAWALPIRPIDLTRSTTSRPITSGSAEPDSDAIGSLIEKLDPNELSRSLQPLS